MIGKILIITTHRVQFAEYFEHCKSSQLYYQDTHLRTAKILLLSFQLQLY